MLGGVICIVSRLICFFEYGQALDRYPFSEIEVKRDSQSGLSTVPIANNANLRKDAGIGSSGSIQISGFLAFVSLCSLVLVVGFGAYRCYKNQQLNSKGYRVVLQKD